MHKLYFWSEFLDKLLLDLDLLKMGSINDRFDFFFTEISSILNLEYYKYLSLNVVRCGSPINNLFKPLDIKPYYCNTNPHIDSNLSNEIKSVFEYEVNLQLDVLQNEYKYWNKIKSCFSNTNMNFIEVKEFFEGDVLHYFKLHTLVSEDKIYHNKIVSTPKNDKSLYLNKDKINVISLDTIISTIK